MNLRYGILPILLFINGSLLFAGGVVDSFKKATAVNLGPTGEQLFVDIVQEKKNQLQKLQEERTARLAQREEKIAKEEEQIEDIQNTIYALEHTLQRHQHNQFLNKKLDLYKELLQVNKDKQRLEEDSLILIETLINALTQFTQDPEFNTFKKERHLEEQLYYSFDDLHVIHDMIVTQERLVAQLAEQEKNTQAEQDSRRRTTKTIDDEHTKRIEELRLFSEQSIEESYQRDISADQQEKELIAIEEQLYRGKKEYLDLRLQDSKYALDLVQIRLLVERSHLDLLRQHLRIVKSAIRVNESDVTYAKELYNTQKQEYFGRKEQYQQERDRATTIQKMKERLRDSYAKEHNLALGRDLDEWNREPKQTVSSYTTLATLGVLNSEVLWLQKERDFLETQRALEDEKFNHLTTQVNAKDAYYKISSRKFVTAEEITQLIKQSEAHKAEAQATLSIYRERINTDADLLNQHKKILDNIAAWRERIARQRDYIFKGKSAEYTHMLELLNAAEEFVKKRMDVLGKLTGTYSGIISEINANIRLLSFIIGELQSITIWYRPEYAVTWEGVKSIGPNIATFLNDLRSFIVRAQITKIFAKVQTIFDTPMVLLLSMLKFLALLLILYLFYFLLPISRDFLARYQTKSVFMRMGKLILYILCNFAMHHYIGLAIWTCLLFIIVTFIADPYVYSIFCLLCIPYFIYLVHRFMMYLIHCNIKNDYQILSADFQRRFVVVCSTLIYATLTIFLFRQAFMRVSYYRTELPTILLAINFIIFQIALIFLITKDQILSIIPSRNDAWMWIREQVDRYFYLILSFVIAIIIMSNPYVGFGRLVLYLLSSLLYTLLLFKALIALYGWIKQAASYTFFIEDEEMVRERFDHARTWFGLLIIASFFLVTFLGAIASAKIWGWQISFRDVIAIATKPLLLESTAYPITIVSVLQIICFILAGFVAAYAINRFVLEKIFELLLVDPGVQYTTTRFIQYAVVIIFIFFGFKNVGLGDLVGYIIGALALGIGWYVREPIGDLVAYFIILVQRPLKIGDFIQIDQEVFGFVRKITPRAVVIRRRNSTTVVVPNSQIINRAIVNWNYVRNFIAFNDILIVIAYKEDPARVRDLLMGAVSSHPNVLRNPKPIVRLEDFGEYGFIFMVRGFISSAYTLEMWDIAADVRLMMTKVLQENNIEIAEVARIIREGTNRLAQMSPQQKEAMERKVRD